MSRIRNAENKSRGVNARKILIQETERCERRSTEMEEEELKEGEGNCEITDDEIQPLF